VPASRTHILHTAPPDPSTGATTVRVEVSDSAARGASYVQEWKFSRDDAQALTRMRGGLAPDVRDEAQLSGLGFVYDPETKSVMHYVDWNIPGVGAGKLTVVVSAVGN